MAFLPKYNPEQPVNRNTTFFEELGLSVRVA
jgi:hypothetical protein